MANILVTGANGQLGSELRKKGFSFLDEVFYTDRDELDITDYERVERFVKSREIDTIINCAAYTAVEKAEDESGQAVLLNVHGVANLAQVAKKENCLLIHLSTDYVFDGKATEPYTEKAVTGPLSVYGKTKRAGEEAILQSGCFYMIIRTSWLYSVTGNNFVRNILSLARERLEIQVVQDQVGTPTYAGDLAAAIVAIMENDERIEHEGIYHYSNDGECSWYDFATEIVRQSGLDCKIQPIATAAYPGKAVRPAYSVLDKSKIRKVFGVTVPDWKEALGRMLKEMQSF